MADVTAQISLYPLRQPSIGPAIREVIQVFRDHGLETHTTPMSTLVWGDEETFFDALREAYRRVAQRGDVVLLVSLTNAAPSPERIREGDLFGSFG